MTQRGVTEWVVEQAALAWFESIGWSVRHGAEIAPGELPLRCAERFIVRATA
jgi:type I restriction enzyme R subunit